MEEGTENSGAAAAGTVAPCVPADVAAAITERKEHAVSREESGLGADTADADELAGHGCAGSDSGVETCGRALSSGGGSRSCASSVVSCGSGCGSESSSLAGGVPPRTRRRVAVAEPPRPVGASTPRIVPRGPNLATRERARSREKPTVPEKPRPLTPKPRARPPGDLPSLARESPALRVKQTRTSTARCRPATPNSPTGPAARLAATPPDQLAARVTADKYATLPRRRRDAADADGSPRRGASVSREPPPPVARRPTLTRTASSRAPARTRVRIYAEAGSQTALVSADVEAALAGRAVRTDVLAAEKVSRGVQAERRDTELERLEARARRAAAESAEERARRERAERELEEERRLRRAAQDELANNTRRLLELSGGGAGGGGGEGVGAGGECLRALGEQLRAAADLAAQHRREIDTLRDTCRTLQTEACAGAAAAHALERRLAEVEAEAAEMHEFLAAEKLSLQESLRDTEQELAAAHHELVRRRAECRQLVRLCEQRRQEALAAVARARGGGGGVAGGAAVALDSLARRLRALVHNLAPHDPDDAIFYNEAYSRSDSGGGRTPDEPPSWWREGDSAPRGLPRTVPVTTSFSESRDDRSEDNSADLLDSETEPCLVTDAAFEEGSTSPNPTCGLATDISSIQVTESRRATRADGFSLCIEGEARRFEAGGGEDSCNSLHNVGAWSADELSPVRSGQSGALPDELSERESLHNLSAAILQRQQSEAEHSAAEDDGNRVLLLDKVVVVDNLVTELLKIMRAVQLQGDSAANQLQTIRERVGEPERDVVETVASKLQELDASRDLLQQCKRTVEELTAQLGDTTDILPEVSGEESVGGVCESETALRYEALDACLATLGARQRVVSSWPRLATLQATLERLAFTLLSPRTVPSHTTHTTHTTHTIDSAA